MVTSNGEGTGMASYITCGASSKSPGRTGPLHEEVRLEISRQEDLEGSQRVIFSSVGISSCCTLHPMYVFLNSEVHRFL